MSLTFTIRVRGSQYKFAEANLRHLGCGLPVCPVKPSGQTQLVDPGHRTHSTDTSTFIIAQMQFIRAT